jgi:hypothetical protein
VNCTKTKQVKTMFPIIVAFVALLALLDFAALQWGADSRDLSVDPRYPTATGLR